MIKGKRWGSRTGRIVLAGAVAALAAISLVGTAQATTASQQIQFDYGRLKLGASPALDIVDTANSAHWVKLNATVCTALSGGCTGAGSAVGDFTVTPANLNFPPRIGDVPGYAGETATVDLTPLADITGHWDLASGVMTTNASNYRSNVTLAGPFAAAACRVTPISLAFSTGKTTPFLGDAFDALGVLAEPRNGVIDADWATLPTPGDNPDVVGDDSGLCATLLNAITMGPGGVSLGRDINPVLAQAGGGGGGTVAPPAPKKKKCKKGQKKVKVHGKIKCKKKK